eukprot:m.161504 g.161504  ORF g.161504 m.161504 type:complete len:114 (-) comp16530_c1_seq5:4300-4641(-)
MMQPSCLHAGLQLLTTMLSSTPPYRRLHVQQGGTMLDQVGIVQRLGQDISNHVLRTTVHQAHQSALHLLTNEVVDDVHMTNATRHGISSSNGNGSSVVTMHDDGLGYRKLQLE